MSEVTEAEVEAAVAAYTEACGGTKPCPTCDGRGYHHGFGEHGHDPDWCETCGGPGLVPTFDEQSAMRAAVEAAVAARAPEGRCGGEVERLRQAHIDIGTLLANLRYLEEVTGETLDGEDAEMVAEIEKEHKARDGGERLPKEG